MRRLVGWCAVGMTAGLGLGVASHAWSAVLLDDNFDGETVPAGSWIMNDGSLTNFNVTSGSVDLLTVGNPFGLVGSGTNSTGNVVDLDGTTFAGGTLLTKATYSFNAGDTVTLSIDVGGNERSGTDGLFAGFSFVGAPTITNISTSGLGSPVQSAGELTGTATLGSTDPFQVFTISFVAQSNGGLKAFVGTNSADNMGPLLDRVTITDLATDVPEPQAWALMIVGFGGLGALLRRRRIATA